MRLTAEDIDEEFYIDIIVNKQDLDSLLDGEFVQSSGHLMKKQINILLALEESYRYGKEEGR